MSEQHIKDAPQVKEQKSVTASGKQKRNKIVATAVMFIAFLIALYMIFGGTAGRDKQTDKGLNPNVPDGREQQMASDKRAAVEREKMKEQQTQRVKTLAQSAFNLIDGDPVQERPSPRKRDNIERSRQTYRDVSRQVASFDVETSERAQIEALKKQVEELSARLARPDTSRRDPLELMEKSYRLASKYLLVPGGGAVPRTEAAAGGKKPVI